MSPKEPGLTPAEVRELGDRWGIRVTPAEADALASRVADRLADDLEQVYDIPVPTESADTGGRSWSEGTDEYNAIATACDIPPTPDHDGLLEGMTIGLKDIIRVADVPMQCGSEAMRGYLPSSDATVVTRLRKAGGRITAKTTLDEFAGGGRGHTSRGLVLNPRDSNRIAGGSSGGSGAAVAADLVDLALGTDTGGSTRKPAAFCGIIGLKPTYGLVPLTGVVENTYTLDHVGIIARTVDDTAKGLEALAGRDPADPASMAAAGRDTYTSTSYVDAVADPPALADFTLGVASQGLSDDIHEHIADHYRAAVDYLSETDATLERVDLPYLDQIKHVKNIISYSELAAFWRARGHSFRRPGWDIAFDQTSFARHTAEATGELNPFYRSRMLAGAHLHDAHAGQHYARARAARVTAREELSAVLEDIDAILTPTVPDPAPTIDEVRDPDFDYDGLRSQFGYGRYTKIANVTGTPALTIPIAESTSPAVGLQLIGSWFDEARLLAAGKRLQSTVADAHPD